MKYEDIYYLCDIIHTFVGINIMFYDSNRTFIFELNNIEPKLNNIAFITRNIDDIFDSLKNKPENQIYILSDELGIHYMSTLIRYGGLIIIGPYLSHRIINHTSSINNNLLKNISNYTKSFIDLIPILNRKKLLKVCDFVNSIKFSTIKSSNIHTNFTTTNYLPRILNRSIETTQNINNIINMRYNLENEILHLISYGKFEDVKKIYINHRDVMTLDDRIPDDPIRCAKNYLIIDNTTFRKAIEQAGVPPIYIHNISEQYALRIEKITSIEEYYELLFIMIKDYCEIVDSYSTRNYSPIIRQTIAFIISNINEKLSTKYIADELHINSTYLSRQFKTETGETLIRYIHNIKINESKYYLIQGKYTITQIALLLGFNDSNYFTRIFKKMTNTTPYQFIKSNDIYGK
ncbi:AraC family transcriptional regulator [Vallitalea longa]|uniref:AraC family transcriptional regulator n=1 Tax=Vallitalea longa TaxID=2936439 RepID=A0A9W5YEU8_9FIRM|nr:AraC family transcriptional regulator [Vallitalea longa]GKX30654.1 AraC family transcriptional regulator [Vallitalea longa]